MGKVRIVPASKKLKGNIFCPPDKSLSHRAAMIGALSSGETIIQNFSFCQDTWSTLHCLELLGVKVQALPNQGMVRISSSGKESLSEPSDVLDVGNSGTTLRLITGIIAGIQGLSILTGDQSIRRRPMKRIIDPLRKTGVVIGGRDRDQYAPLYIIGKKPLQAFHHTLEIPSAQVKSCLLFAALWGDNPSFIKEPILSRNHTENMLKAVGSDIRKQEEVIQVYPGKELKARSFNLPGDVSSAAFLIAAALLISGSYIIIQNLGLNPTRTGMLDCLQRMGAIIKTFNTREEWGERQGNIAVEHSILNHFEIDQEEIPSLIDEIPILSVLATQAHGRSIIRGAGELRVKESDRLHAISENLISLGALVDETKDGLAISGPVRLKGGKVKSYGDHRIAMSMVIAGLIADTPVEVEDIECISISYPNFFQDLQKIGYGDFQIFPDTSLMNPNEQEEA
ncbi:MAG TPA: 3-phosphoshikimate 1-carboxyvinyltransferase [Candidatus Atribacteria bacterium]|nr:3-phosphoshikimate 1-carboxyvinyltransferase [Candidatus Atribacteria bacterium]HCU22969.1 3-phosphoshikimate 1-carboxyvinyltransferase [Candidatus Atribacteria bacterium]